MKRACVGILAVLALCSAASWAAAADYRFAVPEMRVVLTVQPDASVIVDYRITFQNLAGAHPIDVVDVGMPTEDYRVLSASLDGKALHTWRPSTEIAIGPEVPLAPYAIPPGATGVFECRARVADMVYRDSMTERRASLRFTPTWFGRRYVAGETSLLLVVRFPPGLSPNDVVWHSDDRKFFEKGILDPEGVPFVCWKERYALTGPVMFGCSFPRSVMARVAAASPWTRLVRAFRQSREAQQISGVAFVALFALFFLLITRGTGITLLFVFLAGAVTGMVLSPALHLGLWPLVPILALVWLFTVRRARAEYLPALAKVESGKVRRDLTSAEAAVLQNAPLPRVLAMVLANLLAKGVIRIVTEHPRVVDPVGSRAEPNVVALPGGARVALEPYEVGFMDVLADPPREVGRKDFTEPLRRLIGLVQHKMHGFDPETTRDYYRRVNERAWEKVDAESDPARKDDLASRYATWMLLSEDYDDRVRTRRNRGWTFLPEWYRPLWQNNTGDWADDLTASVRSCADRAASVVEIPAKGLNLSGIDRFTLDTLTQLAESAGKGGGGHGGCACACAGCACACACAGGGR